MLNSSFTLSNHSSTYMWFPRICSTCGDKLKKMKTSRSLHVAGQGPIVDYGMYLTNSQGHVTEVVGLYKCVTCGEIRWFDMAPAIGGKKT